MVILYFVLKAYLSTGFFLLFLLMQRLSSIKLANLKNIKLEQSKTSNTLKKLVCNVELQGFMDDHLDFVGFYATYSARQIGIPTSKVIHLPADLKKFHVNKGPFVHAKTKEVFEQRKFRRLIQAFDSNPETINGWISYLNSNMPSGIKMNVTRFEYHPVDYLKNLPVPEKPSKISHAEKVQQEIDAYLKKFNEQK